MKMSPIGYRVVIKIEQSDKEKQLTSSVLEFAKNTIKKEQRSQQLATIIEIGPTAFKGSDFVNTDIKVGDKILFTRHSGESQNGDFTYKVINDDDVLCIMRDGEYNA